MTWKYSQEATAMIKSLIKSTLKTACTLAAPLCARRSAMTEEDALALLQAFSPRPTGTALTKNTVLEPSCDLQIIIPAYNVEPYLADCLDSVLSQQTKYRFHVVLVDDGSTDATPAIADRYAGDPKLTIIHQANRGFSGARNVALETIFGKYLMFVDSDDILHPGAIEALLSEAFAHDCDVVEGGAYYLTGTEQTLMYRYEKSGSADPFTFHGQPWAKVYKARLFQNLQFPEGFWYEDSILAFLLWPVVKNPRRIPAMAYIHRRNPQGITAASRGRPKAIDTCWITQQLMAERETLGLPKDEAYFAQLIDQIRLNHYRVKALPKDIQEAAFVLTCGLLNTRFPTFPQQTTLTKALKEKNFGTFQMCCKFY